MHLFHNRYQGHVSAALVLGGVDINGPHLFTVSGAACIWHSVLCCTSRLCRAGLVAGSRAAPVYTAAGVLTPPAHPATLSPLPQVFPHGSTDCLPFATMGSGSLNAMAVFESGFKEDMTKEEAMALVAAGIRRCLLCALVPGALCSGCAAAWSRSLGPWQHAGTLTFAAAIVRTTPAAHAPRARTLPTRAPRSGVYNDLGSGSNVDLCIITKGGVEYLRNYEFLQTKTYSRKFPVKYPKGTARESQAPPPASALGR